MDPGKGETMFTEDYVMRMIRQALAVFARVAGLKKAGRHEEAQQALDQALEILMGLDAGVIKQMDDDSLLDALTTGDHLDADRLAVLADVFREEGEILAAQGRPVESQADFLRALNFFIVAAWNLDPADPPVVDPRIAVLYRKLAGKALRRDALLQLEDYYAHVIEKPAQVLAAAGSTKQEMEKILGEIRHRLGK
jgi:tetratricopeptide (TPR) repeat protein